MLKPFSSPLLLALLALMGIGLVQVYSSSYVFATEEFGNGLFFFQRQFVFAGLGLAVLVGASMLPFEWIKKWAWLLWVGASIGVLMTFVPGLGVRVGGSVRWLDLPFGLRFEPSELLKFSTGILFATLLIRREGFLNRVHGFWILLAILVPTFLLLKQPDLGSFALIFAVFLSLLFVFGLKWRYIIASVMLAIPTFYVLVMSQPYRRARVFAFLDPWADPEAKGFQIIQSMLSFSSGGILGQGLGQGQGKLFFLPEAHTDFTMAVLGEEMGFIGFVLILSLYAFIILRGFQIATRCEDVFRKAAALGITLTFAFSVFINVGVVTGLLPTKGLTLPFLSYGGSSLVVLCLMFGFLLNIEKSLQQESQSPFFRRSQRL
jgi:cell division protein FtsW